MDHLTPVRRSGRTLFVALLAVVALLVPLGVGGLASANPESSSHGHGPRPTIVLVHGDWADRSSWNAVTERLQDRGFTVVAPPNPLRGPATDAPYLASFLQTISGPIVLVAHSYGGFVATNAATGNANVKALVYIDAFVPDTGQTLADLAVDSCVDPTSAVDPVPGPGGIVDLYLHRDARAPYTGYSKCFANGVDRDQAAQRIMSTNAGAHISTVNAGHLSLVTRPNTVTDVILAAVNATT